MMMDLLKTFILLFCFSVFVSISLFNLSWTTKVTMTPIARFYQKSCFLCHSHNNNLYDSMTSLTSTEENWRHILPHTHAHTGSLSRALSLAYIWPQVWRYKDCLALCMCVCPTVWALEIAVRLRFLVCLSETMRMYVWVFLSPYCCVFDAVKKMY